MQLKYKLFDDLPILPKLLLIPVAPLLFLLLLGTMTYMGLLTFFDDEERLNASYVLQKTAAQYMRSVADLETTFLGYVLTKDERYLNSFEEGKRTLLTFERELAGRLPPEEDPPFRELHRLVTQYVEEKEKYIHNIQNGFPAEAALYIQSGKSREMMVEIRDWMKRFDELERQTTKTELAQLSYDQYWAITIMLIGAVVTLALVIVGQAYIAQSIAAPLVDLSKTVSSGGGETVPVIPSLERRDEIGELTRVMGKMSSRIRQDVEELQQSAYALKKLNAYLSTSEAKYRGLVDHAPVGIVMTKGVKVTFSNRYNQQLAGLDPEQEVAPSTFLQRIHPEDRNGVLMTLAQAVAEGRPCETIFRFVHDDGNVRKILSRHVPIMDFDSSDIIYMGFNIDITALESLQVRLNRAENLATLGQVAAGIAHELRNPLVGIGSTAKVLLDEFEADDAKRREIEVILSETRRLDRIVNEIVDFARVRRLAPTRVDLVQLVDEVSNLLKVRLDEKELSIKTNVSPMISEIHADRDQLRQVLLNVVHNAIDATPTRGEPIQITADELFREERPGIMIRVKDAGHGIPLELLGQVFQPFVTAGKRSGTGLGLAICKNIVEAHGGDIYVTSEVGKGTILGVWMPLEQEPISNKV
ncbi:MAG: ATP-binding protein [Nitrospira sp.]|nr:CHASE3 domain-containing protein [Nitrospira sp.]MDR4464915.1 ATP-binding protein [Nitrospira sp.]